MVFAKLEVLVDFGANLDQESLNRTLNHLKAQTEIKTAVFKDGAIMVETTLPNQKVLDMVVETSGKRAVLQGFGETQSAVAMVSNQTFTEGSALGVIRFQQAEGGALLADGSIDRLPPGPHGLHVRTVGDISQGCHSLGAHYNPGGCAHGAPDDPPGCKHAGDLGNILADERGRATFRIISDCLKISEIIGRSIAVTERADDLGRGKSPHSKIDGDSGPPIACGIIARSAGIFENPKRICQCDGVVVWDERDRPLAGKGRRKEDNCCAKEGEGDKPKQKSCCANH